MARWKPFSDFRHTTLDHEFVTLTAILLSLCLFQLDSRHFYINPPRHINVSDNPDNGFNYSAILGGNGHLIIDIDLDSNPWDEDGRASGNNRPRVAGAAFFVKALTLINRFPYWIVPLIFPNRPLD